MKVSSNYNAATIFFRLFNWNDGVLAVGFDEGTLGPGESVDYFVAGFGRFKIEIKENDLHGKVLLAALPGPHWHDNNAHFTVEKSGVVNVSTV